jgi:hypothetical protein
MVTRRQVLIGVSSAGLGGAVVSAGAFSSNVAAGADMRVVVVSELQLDPARPDRGETDPDYVDQNDNGQIEITIEKLSQRARSEFAELVRVTNNGDLTYDELRFEFSAESGNSSVTETLGITAEETVTEDDGVFTLLAGSDELVPGDSVVFGIVVNLLPSAGADLSNFPDGTAALTLVIEAVEN